MMKFKENLGLNYYIDDHCDPKQIFKLYPKVVILGIRKNKQMIVLVLKIRYLVYLKCKIICSDS